LRSAAVDVQDAFMQIPETHDASGRQRASSPSGLTFEDAGEHELTGVPDRWHLVRAVG
jgi:hypothetical protein